jgi:hypothetical protein
MFRLVFIVALVVHVASEVTRCTLCNDGSIPVEPSDPQIAGICKQIIELLPSLDADGCTPFQQGEYPRLCGCLSASAYACNVCPDGSEPNPFGAANIETCSKIKFAAAFSTTDEACHENLAPYAAQTSISSVCGCPGSPVPCTICPEGNQVGNPQKLIGALNTCEGYDYFLRSYSVGSPECKGKNESSLPFHCECPGIGEGKTCTTCGGVERGEPRVRSLTNYCNNADYKAIFWPIDSCDDYSDKYDQWACGCPDVVPKCPLCEDGSDFDLTIPSGFSKAGETCAYDQFFLQYLPSLSCPAAQATAGQYCGCNNPTADASACRICGDGIQLTDPSIYVPSFGHTCGFIEYFANQETLSGKKSCTFYRGEYRDVCCNGQPDPYKTEAPGLFQGPILTPMSVEPAPLDPVLIISPPVAPAPIIPLVVVPAPIVPPPYTSTPVDPPPVTPASVVPSPITPTLIIPPPVVPASIVPTHFAPAPSSAAPVTFLVGGNPALVVLVNPVDISKGCKVCLNGGPLRNPTAIIDALGGFTCQYFYDNAEYVPVDGQQCLVIQEAVNQEACGCAPLPLTPAPVEPAPVTTPVTVAPVTF